MDIASGGVTLLAIVGLAIKEYFALKSRKLDIEEKKAAFKEKSAAEQAVLDLKTEVGKIKEELAKVTPALDKVEDQLQQRHDDAIKLWSDRCESLEKDQFQTVLKHGELARKTAENGSSALRDVYGFMEDHLGS